MEQYAYEFINKNGKKVVYHYYVEKKIMIFF